MPGLNSRRNFLRDTGLSAAALPFVLNLPSLGFNSQNRRKRRLIVMFSPNGVVPQTFWPDDEGSDFELKQSLEPLADLKDRTLILHGLADRVRGDGDNHMRGIGCLLTGVELFPGNIQGGSHTPAGWSSGISIDQEIKNFLQQDEGTRTRFGSLEFGVLVPDRADTWTRMIYSGPNRPIAPIDDPYQMFQRLYGQTKDIQTLASVLDDLQEDFKKLSSRVSADDRRLLDQNASFVREMERELTASSEKTQIHDVPELEPGVMDKNDEMPALSKMQIELIVNSFFNDFCRIATLQYTHSVGQAKMRWLDIQEGHHGLSHEPDDNEDAQAKLTKINRWYCEQLAYLAGRLDEIPEPGGSGTLLDNTMIVWSNELGKGNSHTLNDIPFVLVGGGLDFKMGQCLNYRRTPHNRLLLSIAHGFGHELETFGNPDFCKQGPLDLS